MYKWRALPFDQRPLPPTTLPQKEEFMRNRLASPDDIFRDEKRLLDKAA
jgi:hypothetical protein